MSNPTPKQRFERSFRQGGRFVLNEHTGEAWPKLVSLRSFRLYVVAITPQSVTFDVHSIDLEPTFSAALNPQEHGRVSVPYKGTPVETLKAATRLADPLFYSTYTIISPDEARACRLKDGPSFSKDS